MFYWFKKDGLSIWIEVMYMLVCNCVGDVYKVIKVVYDVMKVKIMVDK